ncbi:MAG: NUMOD3 domain-containing DNA-binding protein [Candidatus Omnitrophica bacterium]|jgi:hypothetical protein|nr:NUMOD3 domain-containing DNA-binding protein [Candidatus Omnitrophota bacterium]
MKKGTKHKEETKRKISKYKRGSIPWNKGLTKDMDERINCYSKKLVGKNLSDKTKKKISDKMKIELKNRYNNGFKNPRKGIKLSEETKRKISLANKGRIISEETKKKISNSHLGIRQSEESKRKISMSKQNLSNNIKIKISARNQKIDLKDWCGFKVIENKRIRSSNMWKIWREAVFLRDNFTCQNKNCHYCNNKQGGFLHPHHIKPFSLYPELRFDVNNGITYCKDYHLKSNLHKNMQVGD